jgi:hypothetical protein
MQSTQWNVNFICHTGPRNIHRLWIIIPNKLMLEFWSHAFFFSIKNTYNHSKTWTILQPTKIQELSSHLYAFMILGLVYLYTTQSLYSLSVLIVRANTIFTTLYIRFSSTTWFSRFWPSPGTFYNMHGREYRGGGLPFAVNTFKYIKFRLLLPCRE